MVRDKEKDSWMDIAKYGIKKIFGNKWLVAVFIICLTFIFTANFKCGYKDGFYFEFQAEKVKIPGAGK